jgi:NAD-dependent SIR2 family protein deacetylase
VRLLARIIDWINESYGLIIAAGAGMGMGIGSGLPDFRGAEGF